MKIQFGETVKGYEVPVLNEREVRAGAGILFVAAMTAFFSAWYAGDYLLLKTFIVAFFIDFSIRIFINPRYSPVLILGRLAVHNQKVEYAGAAQKKFAWILGLILSSVMMLILVVGNIVGPINLVLCLTCLSLLFLESSFGVCLGCIIYNRFKKDPYQYCPGGVCGIVKKESIQKISLEHVVILIGFIVTIGALFFYVLPPTLDGLSSQKRVGNVNCEVPDWAKSIEHEDMWRLHHNCE